MALRKKLMGLTAVVALGLGAGTASADVMDIDINGIASWDGAGSPLNTVLLLDLGGGGPVTIDGIGWDLTIDTVGASWLNEATIGFGGTANPNEITLAAGDDAGNTSGFEAFSSNGIISLADIPLPDLALADGVLRLEFYESFDDVVGAIDSFYTGSLAISVTDFVLPVAEPGILMLFGLGLLGVVAARRRSA